MESIAWNQDIVEKAVYLDSMKDNCGVGLGFSCRYIAKYNEGIRGKRRSPGLGCRHAG